MQFYTECNQVPISLEVLPIEGPGEKILKSLFFVAGGFSF